MKRTEFLKYIYFKTTQSWKWGNWIALVTLAFKNLDEYTSLSHSRTRRGSSPGSATYSHLKANKIFDWTASICQISTDILSGLQINIPTNVEKQAGSVQSGLPVQMQFQVEIALGFSGQGGFKRCVIVFVHHWA